MEFSHQLNVTKVMSLHQAELPVENKEDSPGF
jgi:hypothetical protein